MVVGVAFCPSPPVLVPELARGAAAELEDLRGACRAAIRAIARPGTQLVVVGSGPVSQAHPVGATGSFAGFGAAVDVVLGRSGPAQAATLPLSLTIGGWLAADALGPDNGAVGLEVGPDESLGLPDGELALLVVGDGSARRSTAAPGYLDPRAERFDAEVQAALAAGDGGRLAELDAGLGAELLAAGVPAWRAVGRAVGGGWRADLRYAAAPYGVGYFAADWTRSD